MRGSPPERLLPRRGPLRPNQALSPNARRPAPLPHLRHQKDQKAKILFRWIITLLCYGQTYLRVVDLWT